ncbi:MAG: hemerythrin domain-containing protein [Chitinophagaceae bacterium]|nr:hemerythrin domain-containing protein [Chitinophagaceae bacterium]MBK8951237.1 hemerythrin domain-containing protein [Chitinophagaceae bacterium]
MVPKTLKPVKRHDALVKFSKEHHFGLLLCWKIRQGVMDKISEKRITEYVLYFFDADLKKHFEAEEKELFVKLSPDDELRTQAVKEHEVIYAMINNWRKVSSSTEELLVFADTLDKHIRFEERVLFNHLQELLSEAELTELINCHSGNDADADVAWNDKFWLT